jgi:hypothetical protein
MPRWPGHVQPIRAAVVRGGHGRVTASTANALANKREHRMGEVKVSSGVLAIKPIRALPQSALPTVVRWPATALQKIWACMTNANYHVKYNICHKKYFMTKI